MNSFIRHGATLAAVVLGLGAVGAGCLTRPVEHANPNTVTNVQIQVPNQVIDKVDMLFDIDNSASMGDKQRFLSLAIPDLISRLLNPNCLDPAGAVIAPSAAGVCAMGKPEFNAVHDMHLAIVTSSLGPRLPTGAAASTDAVCTAVLYGENDAPGTTNDPYAAIPTHNDDRAELISRSLALTVTPPMEGTVTDATTGFLYWFPDTTATPAPGAAPVVKEPVLQTDFGSLVTGAGFFGCGIESQLETWYRFLVQPDPYDSITKDASGRATWSGVDATILQQRHDFLRPDSLVAVVVLSDENDSEIDVRSVGGTAFQFMNRNYPLPHGTSACDMDPALSACHNCGSADTADPKCQPGQASYAGSNPNSWGYDINLRHVHMKAKYGLDPQFPIGRYVLGLTSALVPSRAQEYPPTGGYDGRHPDCVNPLFAAALPEGGHAKDDPGSTGVAQALCKLPLGPRANLPSQNGLIFYAHIGGVPWQLLHFNPKDATKSLLTQADWVRILGKGPASYAIDQAPSYDYSGIDPHMIEDYRDRTTVQYNFPTDSSLTNPLAPSTGGNADPVNGREWVTDQPSGLPGAVAMGTTPANPHVFAVDRQYACIFPIAPRDCMQPANANSCDCPSVAMGLTGPEVPAVCDPAKPTSQIYAKAYPTTRELLLAKLMGNQGIVSSICPQETVDMTSPVYGYRPAVAVIIDKLKKALTNACLPQKLDVDPTTGSVPCLILVTLPAGGSGTCKNPTCDESKGLFGPNSTTHPLDQDILNKFCDSAEATYVGNGGTKGDVADPINQSVCQLQQLTMNDSNAANEFQGGSCANPVPVSGAPPVRGWCYVTGAAANGCSQAIQFASGSPPGGSVTSLQCIEKRISVINNTTTQ